MPTPTRRLILGANFGPLEDRTMPAQFGLPWPDASHLTLSFAPDGTSTPAGPSQSSAVFGGSTNWQREVLRAFQWWASKTNVNIGLVADGGQPLGTPGAVQGDKRFGDVRIATAPVPDPTESAFASPFTWAGSTLAGDVILDSTAALGLGTGAVVDVRTVAAHEAGHALGLDHSAETASVLYPTYSYKSGLSAGDVTQIQALYGVRKPDGYDAARSNDTTAAASGLTAVTGVASQWQAVGDITTATDVDYYKVTVANGVTSLVGRLKVSGVSLLTAKYTVTDSLGKVVASGSASDPLKNDLTFQVNSPAPGDYFVRVEGASKNAFGIGGYQLVVDQTTAANPQPAALPVALPTSDSGSNETQSTATPLNPDQVTDRRFDAAYSAAIESPYDSDFYKVRAPQVASGMLAMNVLSWGTDATNPLSPKLHVYDDSFRPVAYQVLANDTGVVSVRVANVTPGKDYYVLVMARAPGQMGNYYLGVDFNQLATVSPVGVASGTLAAGSTTTVTGTLTVGQSTVYQLFATATLTGFGMGGVTVDVVNACGTTVASLTTQGYQPAVTRAVYLPAGTYTVRYRYAAPAWGMAADVRYDLFLMALTDPIGPKPTSTTTTLDPASCDGTVYTGSSSTTPTGMATVY